MTEAPVAWSAVTSSVGDSPRARQASIASRSAARPAACGVSAAQRPSRGTGATTRSPSARCRLSRTGLARRAAPSRSAAAATRPMSSARTSGRAASCTRTRSACSPRASRPARTESARVAPPRCGVSRPARPPGGCYTSWSSAGATTTTAAIPGAAANARACAPGRPARELQPALAHLAPRQVERQPRRRRGSGAGWRGWSLGSRGERRLRAMARPSPRVRDLLPELPADHGRRIVLGIDPGTQVVGYGAVVDRREGPVLLAAGAARPGGVSVPAPRLAPRAGRPPPWASTRVGGSPERLQRAQPRHRPAHRRGAPRGRAGGRRERVSRGARDHAGGGQEGAGGERPGRQGAVAQMVAPASRSEAPRPSTPRTPNHRLTLLARERFASRTVAGSGH